MAGRYIAICALLAACCVAHAANSSDGHDDDAIDFKNPVRSANDDEIHSLPGLSTKLPFKHYSGYLNADDKQNRFWHYWFVESQSNPDKDPLVLWLNGGPGCSSLLGLLTENGPYSVSNDGQVQMNPYSWNKRANVVYMESPAGVGFSYAADGDITADDDTTAKQNHAALRSFLRKFPSLANRPLYLTGESYGGVYLPTLASLVDDDKELNLKGVAIGNGYLDANKNAESLVYFSYYHGLVGRSTWSKLSKHCCGGKPPARGNCDFLNPARSDECSAAVRKATDDILASGVNPYNLYDRCAQPAAAAAAVVGGDALIHSSGREHFDRSLLRSAFNVTSIASHKSKRAHRNLIGRHYRNLVGAQPSSSSSSPREFYVQPKVGGDPPCTNDATVINYLNTNEARKALHIPQGLKTPFTTCFDGIQYTMIYPNKQGGLAPQINKLIASPRDLTLLVYNGDVDMMCNFFGDEWFVDDLGRKVIVDYEPWHVNGQVAGFVKHYDRITYMTVKGSGHMVPTDKPAEALAMIEVFLFGHEKH